MARRLFRKYLPDAQKVREHPSLKPLGKWLHDPQLWHLHRRSVAGACFIGCFCAFLPLPMHMLFAGTLAILTRSNLPISLALVWITNPITIPPLFFFAYKLGAWLLHTELKVSTVQLDLAWLKEEFAQIWRPLLLGSLLCGWVTGVTAFVLVHIVWRIDVAYRWRKRRRERQSRQSS